ncbi:c-type cytochrome [Agrobacterium tumefaciens]|uniref:c-type cytochrome n=1 Tax=Agrobacterium tumefaciens TaxID=358 RepID=UPI0021CEEB6D|nr:cytochrome c family protein [Agrobacterium tumefaciens]UXS27017.1 cytochrome c family protein [Agrobacterium tumefaciens]UXS54484.1 cytochrome c family protein [Agrobacterium tumefaciens]UXS65542.1 cytochrome c family protein [Agrobacterium tumefaciens]
MSYRFLAICLLFATTLPLDAHAQEGDPAAGATVFKKCGICHVAETDQNKVGPSLNGLFGRAAGTHPNFAYSRAMQDAGKAGLVWDETSFRDYLHDPKAKVKGTKMAFVGVKDDTDITNLIAYLKQYSK